MKVGIVGAGISGLSCGRELARAGFEVVLFEKSQTVGGRVETRSADGFVWDTGATSIAPHGLAIASFIQQDLADADLIKIEGRVDVHSALRVSHGDSRNEVPRYVYASGINTLAQRLAIGQNIQLGSPVEAIERVGSRFRINSLTFDAVVLTPPIPQTSLLLWGLQEDRPLANASYRPCLSVLLGYRSIMPETPHWALVETEQRHPLNWLSIESHKSPGRAPTGCSALVLQLGPRFSLEHFDRPDPEIIATASSYVRQLFGDSFVQPYVSEIRRWKFAQPETTAEFDEVNPPGSLIVVGGDGVFGGHIESAFESGVMCARRLISGGQSTA